MRCRRVYEKLHTEDAGVSMILIVVLIAFLSILMSVLFTTTMVGYRMKSSQAHARNNFYIAEKTLEEERAEIAEQVSHALSKAYLTMTEQFVTTPAEDRAAVFSEAFRDALLKELDPSLKKETFDDRVVIRDYDVSHTDDAGFFTGIRTDIVILIPDEAYFKTHAVMEVKDLVVYENYTEY